MVALILESVVAGHVVSTRSGALISITSAACGKRSRVNANVHELRLLRGQHKEQQTLVSAKYSGAPYLFEP